MFYSPLNLTQEQKLVYVKVLIFLARSDQFFTVSEQTFIKQLMQRFRLSPDVLKGLSVPKDIEDVYDILKSVNDRKIALDLIHCMWFAASTDERIADEEVDIIRKIAKFWHIDDDTVLAINDFVQDEIMFLERTRKVLETEIVCCS